MSETSRRANEIRNENDWIPKELWPQLSEAYHAAIFENPYEFSAHAGLAEYLFHCRYDNQSALGHYEFCLQIDPLNADVREGVIEFFKTLAGMSFSKDAIAIFEILEKMDPSPVDIENDGTWSRAVLQIAYSCQRENRPEKALHYYNLLDSICPGQRVTSGIGQSYLQMEQYGRAIEAFQKLTESAPKEGYKWLGKTYQEMGRNEDAIECYSQLAECDPVTGLESLADAYTKLGRNEEANAQREKLLEYCKSHFDGEPQAIIQTARTMIDAYRKLGQPEGAFAYFQQLDNSGPSPNSGTCGLAVLYMHRFEYGKTIACYQRLADAEEELFGPYRRELVMTYLLFDRHEEAVAEFERIAAAGGQNKLFSQTFSFVGSVLRHTPDSSALIERIGRLEEQLAPRL